MYLQELSLWNFRNHSEKYFSFPNHIIGICGKNGTGKTNLLDAIYCLCTGRSALSFTDLQNVQHKQKQFTLHGLFHQQNQICRVGISYTHGQKKQVQLDRQRIKLSQYIGLFPCVFVSPLDNDLIRGGSEIRRRYLDLICSQTTRDYLRSIMTYKRTLKQRNELIKQITTKKQPESAIGVYDKLLSECGTVIFEKRKKFLYQWNVICQEKYSQISLSGEKISLQYQSQLCNGNFYEQLIRCHALDLEKQTSTIGIHKDDISLIFEDKQAKRFASQGQQKTFLLAIKMSGSEMIRKIKKVDPILLLDDLFDKLDPERSSAFLKYLQNYHRGQQIFITDTQTSRIENYAQELGLQVKVIGT